MPFYLLKIRYIKLKSNLFTKPKEYTPPWAFFYLKLRLAFEVQHHVVGIIPDSDF